MAKVLLYAHDRISKSMAGPAIRYWEFAKALSKSHSVTLLSKHPIEIHSDAFKTIDLKNETLEQLIQSHDVIVTQEVSFRVAYFAKKHGVQLVLDSYDPLPIEALEVHRFDSDLKQKAQHQRVIDATQFSFLMADKVMCASPVQKSLWVGFMAAMGLITPKAYLLDSSFNHKIGIVPFGISSQAPVHSGNGLRSQFKFSERDFVLVWGGGIWNWFDPLTLIRAMKTLVQEYPHIKLVFMGTKHPNPDIKEMKMTKDALDLSKELGLFEKTVFFNFGWVPYDQRQNFLLDADVGVSCHFDQLETHFSFRTRILDYLWCEKPIISTKGDFFAESIERNQLGVTVQANDCQSLSEAILHLSLSKDKLELYKKNIAKMKSQFFWENVTLPLDAWINGMKKKEKKQLFSSYSTIAKYFIKIRGRQLIAKALQPFIS